MSEMEKLIALTFVVAVVSFVGAYALSAWMGQRR